MSKFLILTANIGGYDNLVDPPQQFDDCDYVAIVDRKYDVKTWSQFEYIDFSNIDNYRNRRNAKLYKILSTTFFPNYEYIIWHDANHQLKVDPKIILDEYGDFDLLLFKHPHRNCLYKEMEQVYGRFDLQDNIDRQSKFYIKDGFPPNYGLYEMTCSIRKNNQKVNRLEWIWWEQICKFSSRDQCSFMYSVWKLNDELSIKTFNGFANSYAGGSKYFDDYNHLS